MHSVNSQAAWSRAEDSSGVTVAVLDSGFALSHQDLVNRWYSNPGENGGGKETNGTDDDGNGYVDDYRGWDFDAVDNSPQAGQTDPVGDGVAHGTEVAGLVGATSNNGEGVASVARNPVIMPLQVMDDSGAGYSDSITSAIYYAVSMGADVINMSLGTSGDDPAVRDAVDYAVNSNVVVVAAAGNCGNSTAGPCAGGPAGAVTFPASYDRVISVGAIDQNNQRASFSSYGERLDLMAPGSGTINSTAWTAGNAGSAYAGSLYGTSFASPIAASAVALIRSVRPNTSIDDVRALLMASTQKVAGMNGVFYTTNYGHGLLDAGKSIEVATDLNLITESVPKVYQAGNHIADSRFSLSDTLGSGCEVTAETWCTVWLRNTTQSFDRYLPYQKTGLDDSQGWTWSGSVMQRGEWEVRAVQGEHASEIPRTLFSK